jgi:hypothetical protein
MRPFTNRCDRLSIDATVYQSMRPFTNRCDRLLIDATVYQSMRPFINRCDRLPDLSKGFTMKRPEFSHAALARLHRRQTRVERRRWAEQEIHQHAWDN